MQLIIYDVIKKGMANKQSRIDKECDIALLDVYEMSLRRNMDTYYIFHALYNVRENNIKINFDIHNFPLFLF